LLHGEVETSLPQGGASRSEKTSSRIMNENWTPWKMLSATVGAGTLTPGWNLAETPSADEGEWRIFTQRIIFDGAFSGPPVVVIGLTGFDLDQRDGGRVSVKSRDITSEGFLVEITSWRGSRVYAVEFSWLAVGA
jgi:H-type lectin domain